MYQLTSRGSVSGRETAACGDILSVCFDEITC
jgi:hypothetical protein